MASDLLRDPSGRFISRQSLRRQMGLLRERLDEADKRAIEDGARIDALEATVRELRARLGESDLVFQAKSGGYGIRRPLERLP